MPANLLLEDLQQSNGQQINLTRHHDGDIFYTSGEYLISPPPLWQVASRDCVAWLPVDSSINFQYG